MDPIARRYFVMNAFDGVMTALGIIIGGAAAIKDPIAVFKAGFGASIAIMISGFWGAFMAERAERIAEIKEMERQLMRKLDGSKIEREARNKMVELALIDALSPFIGAIIPLFPFILTHFGFIQYRIATILSILLAFALLFALGTFLAKITGENFLKNGLIFASGGFLIGIIMKIFESLF